MKIFVLTVFIFVLNLSALLAGPDVMINPIQSYAASCHLPSGSVIYQWKVDLNNDGRKEILLDTKPTPEELDQEEKENNWNRQTPYERGFTVYVPKADGSGYIVTKGTDFGAYFQVGTVLSVDIRQCYVGNITQLGKWGIVTIDNEPAGRRNPAVATINAYTLEGDHLKVTVLATYNPDKGENALYDQYLKEGKRTKVQLQEVRP